MQSVPSLWSSLLILNKILPALVLPLGWVLAFACYALFTRKRWPIAAAIVTFYLASMPATSSLALGGLEARYPQVAVASIEPSSAIVVLGGIFGPPTENGFIPNLTDAGDRLEAGITLWHGGVAPWLVFTGGQLPWATHVEVEGERSKRVAVARAVPADRIVVTRAVGNTADEALAVAELARLHQWQRIILVTTAWHMPRASRLFRKAGVEVVPFPVDYRIPIHRQIHVVDFVPNAEALHFTETALRELLGIAFYAATGR